MSSWTVLILEPARGMRTGHCPKTYQLGPLRSANSACFRDFLRLITDSGAYSHPSRTTLSFRPRFSPDASSRLAASPRTPAQVWQLLPERPLTSGRLSLTARSYGIGAAHVPVLGAERGFLPLVSEVCGGWSCTVRGELGLVVYPSEVSGGFGRWARYPLWLLNAGGPNRVVGAST